MLWKCCTQFSLVTQCCPTLCDTMDCMLSFPVHHQLPEFNSCPLNRWYDRTISSYVVPFSTCLQSFPASGSFQMGQFFSSDGQSIGTSASVLPMNIQGWFPLGLTGLISLLSQGLSESSPAPQLERINSLVLNFLYCPTLTSMHDYWKNHSFD